MKRRIKIFGKTHFKGVRKIGLDSGILISLVDNEILFSAYDLKIDKEKGLLFTHEICVKEAIEVLSNDYSYSKENAKEEIYDFLDGKNIQIIPRDKSNFDTIKWMFKRCKKANIKFHPPDSFIIADFYRNGINKVYSNNNHFLKACHLFGIDTLKLLIKEKEIEKQIRQIFKRHHK